MNKAQLEIGQEYAVFHGGLFTTRCKPDQPRTYVHRVIRGRLVSKNHPVAYRGKTKSGLLFEAVEGFKLERGHDSDQKIEAGQTFSRTDGHDIICRWNPSTSKRSRSTTAKRPSARRSTANRASVSMR